MQGYVLYRNGEQTTSSDGPVGLLTPNTNAQTICAMNQPKECSESFMDSSSESSMDSFANHYSDEFSVSSVDSSVESSVDSSADSSVDSSAESSDENATFFSRFSPSFLAEILLISQYPKSIIRNLANSWGVKKCYLQNVHSTFVEWSSTEEIIICLLNQYSCETIIVGLAKMKLEKEMHYATTRMEDAVIAHKVFCALGNTFQMKIILHYFRGTVDTIVHNRKTIMELAESVIDEMLKTFKTEHDFWATCLSDAFIAWFSVYGYDHEVSVKGMITHLRKIDHNLKQNTNHGKLLFFSDYFDNSEINMKTVKRYILKFVQKTIDRYEKSAVPESKLSVDDEKAQVHAGQKRLCSSFFDAMVTAIDPPDIVLEKDHDPNEECIGCKTNKKRIALLPCNHKIFCAKCCIHYSLNQDHKTCPQCKAPILGIIRDP